MAIVPDTKDWTWVLQTPCPDCGLDPNSIAREDIAPLVVANAADWAPVLAGPNVGQRPNDTTWSPLEYGCHVRDVFAIFDRRLTLMLREDDPLFANWDQDATAAAERYGEQDPGIVLDELTAAARQIAANFGQVKGQSWLRPGRRSDGSVFTVESLGRYFVHDPVHHLFDVTGRRAGPTES